MKAGLVEVTEVRRRTRRMAGRETMETDLETMCDTPGCTNRVRRYPWNSDHRHETRYCIPCALERQQLTGWGLPPTGGPQLSLVAKELQE
jgi:hypothetical protein